MVSIIVALRSYSNVKPRPFWGYDYLLEVPAFKNADLYPRLNYGMAGDLNLNLLDLSSIQCIYLFWNVVLSRDANGRCKTSGVSLGEYREIVVQYFHVLEKSKHLKSCVTDIVERCSSIPETVKGLLSWKCLCYELLQLKELLRSETSVIDATYLPLNQ